MPNTPQILFLYGIKCRPWIWQPLHELRAGADDIFVEYPHTVTESCLSTQELSQWVANNYFSQGEQYAAVVGHSLGGILALQLAQIPGVTLPKIVFLDSFLHSTTDFFHNLYLPTTAPALKSRIDTMLREENDHYAESLRAEIRRPDFDFVQPALQYTGELYGFYGDRGCGDPEYTFSQLNLPPELQAKLHLHTLANSCHFPMLENPGATQLALSACVPN
jgi:pimeloyl-ACP methyl ester carboxylesterase